MVRMEARVAALAFIRLIRITELGFQPQDTKKSVYGEIILK